MTLKYKNYLYSIHFQEKNSYKDRSFNFFMNKIFKETFKELKENYNKFLKKNNINLFIKLSFSSPNHCFPYRRRCLIDGLMLIQEDGIKDFKACFRDDLEISTTIISKFKQYNNNYELDYEKSINKIYEDFISDLIEFSENNIGNLPNYTSNNFIKENYQTIKFQIKFKDEKNEKIGYIDIQKKKIEKQSKNVEIIGKDLTENDFKCKIKYIIEEYKESLKIDDSIKFDEKDLQILQKMEDKNKKQQKINEEALKKQNFKKKIFDNFENIKNSKNSEEAIENLKEEIRQNNLLTNKEQEEIINDLK